MESNGKRNNKTDKVYFSSGGKYRESAKMLLPYRSAKHKGHPVDEAGLFSTFLFSWMTGLIWKLHKKPPALEELWETSKYDKSEPNSDKFLRLWNEEVRKYGPKKASIIKAAFRFIRTRFIICAIFVIILTACQFVSNGIIVRRLLEYVSDGEPSNLKYGIPLVVAMLCAETLRAILLSSLFAVSYRLGVRLRAGLLLSVFKKVLCIPPSHSTNVGEIVNMCSNDGDRVFEAAYSCTLILSGPVMFIIGTIYCGIIIGPIAIVGCFIFLLVFPIQGVIVKYTNRLRQQAINFTDNRVKCISEVLASIKLIKMYSWEKSFNDVVKKIRNNEKNRLKNALFLQSINIAIASGTPIIATVFTILASIAVGTDLTSAQAFTLVTVYNIMAFALKVTPIAIKSVAEASVSLSRFKKILVQLSFEEYVQELSAESRNVIEVKHASFSWQVKEDEEIKEQKNGKKRVKRKESQKGLLNQVKEEDGSSNTDVICLKDINLKIRKKTVVGICGNVGSGKSSLFSGILSQMRLREGSVKIRGSTAYCSQGAWIMNSTIRENILFGTKYDAQRYKKIVKACCLKPDFETFTSGDLTEVGERGINLSGGQKQRISLARAVYRDGDIFLLDDPLSAVDAHVGKSLFNNVVMGLLRNKTVLIVTHQLQYLPNCDLCLYMNDGTIEEIGTHAELMTAGKQYSEMHKIWAQRKEDTCEIEVKIQRERKVSESPSVNQSTIVDDDQLLEEGRIIEKESSRHGVISLKTYKRYMDAAGGWCSLFNILFLSLLYTGCFQFTTVWLAYWLSFGSGQNATTTTSTISLPSSTSEDVSTSILDNPDLGFYMMVYGLSIIVMIVVGIFRGYVFVYLGLKASHHLHNELFQKILDGTMEFFDTTPAGRIINRFQKDQDMLDIAIPFMTDMALMLSFLLLTCVIFIAIIFPLFLILLVILVPIFVLIMYIFRDAVREMKRLDNHTRSPWLSNIVTSIVGVPTIRAYHRTKDFIDKFIVLLDQQCIPYFLFNCIMSWLSIRLDFITISIAVSCSALIVGMKGAISPAMSGLAISSALLMSGLFQFTVRNIIELEAMFIAADRISEYLDIIPQEPKKKKIQSVDHEKWPLQAVVEFNNVEMRYRENLPLVLKGVSFKLNSRENIGVVGRTGSGKSSLAVSLFRLVEISGGQILIDGIDISKIAIEELRPVLSIIPQDPVLFTGTIRYNLDPFGEYHDEKIWAALECTYLKNTVDNLPNRLDTMVQDNGNNLSMGERQLMCLARAVLRKSKIIILDEATAAIDAETDVAVQETIREHFAESTLLIIAHRLHTVMECDRVLVMDDGRVVEFDSPFNLTQNPNSHLSKLLASSSGHR